MVAFRPGYVENTTNSSGEVIDVTTTLALLLRHPDVAVTQILAILLTAAPLFIRLRAGQPVSTDEHAAGVGC